MGLSINQRFNRLVTATPSNQRWLVDYKIAVIYSKINRIRYTNGNYIFVKMQELQKLFVDICESTKLTLLDAVTLYRKSLYNDDVKERVIKCL